MRAVSSAIAAREGYDAIYCPIDQCYFSAAEINRLSLSECILRVYDMVPAPEGLTSEERRHILGVEACIWTERVSTPDSLEWRLLPRLSPLSELQWSSPAAATTDSDATTTDNLSAYLPRLNHMLRLYQSCGWNPRTDGLP